MNISEEVNILYNCEDYYILNMKTFYIIKDNKHIIRTIVDYIKNKKHYRKVFENILENNGE